MSDALDQRVLPESRVREIEDLLYRKKLPNPTEVILELIQGIRGLEKKIQTLRSDLDQANEQRQHRH